MHQPTFKSFASCMWHHVNRKPFCLFYSRHSQGWHQGDIACKPWPLLIHNSAEGIFELCIPQKRHCVWLPEGEDTQPCSAPVQSWEVNIYWRCASGTYTLQLDDRLRPEQRCSKLACASHTYKLQTVSRAANFTLVFPTSTAIKEITLWPQS